jgi:hypothetical protein
MRILCKKNYLKYIACLGIALLLCGCGKKSTPSPKTSPVQAPETITNGTYKVVKEQIGIYGDTTFVTRPLTTCEMSFRFTFKDGAFSSILCSPTGGNTSDNGDTYTYNSNTGTLIVTDNGLAIPTKVENLTSTGFLWTEPYGGDELVRYQLELVSE